VEGAARFGPLQEPGGAALYVLVGDRHVRVALPPGAAEDVTFDRPLATIDPVDRALVLGLDAEGALWSVRPETGASLGWARHVDRFTRSPRRAYVVYHCDRGVFLVDLRE
jgi:hypothetical protein